MVRISTSVSGAQWPTWGSPAPSDLLALAHALSRLVRFLNPEIVAKIADDNEKHRSEWEAALADRNIDPSQYLWEGCATVFPGIRRYDASEVGNFRQGKRSAKDALLLDDNSYPKQVWSFALRGRRYANFGPAGYQLAHLVDHKPSQNRGNEELLGSSLVAVGQNGLPGLFTSACNTAYVSTEFLRPTDFSGSLRSLLQRQAAGLYGSHCCPLPPGLTFRPAESPEWAVSEFTWAETEGNTDYVSEFLEFRRETMDRLLQLSSTIEDSAQVLDAGAIR